MNTISSIAEKKAKRTALKISLLISGISLFGIGGLLVCNTESQLTSGFSAIRGQITHLLKLGDIFQLRMQMQSLSASNLIDEYDLRLKNGQSIISNLKNSKYSGRSLSNLENRTSFQFHWPDLHILKSISIDIEKNNKAELFLEKRVPLEILAFVLIGETLLFLFSRIFLKRIFLSFGEELAKPIDQLVNEIRHANSIDFLESTSLFKDRFKLKEMHEIIDAFISLLENLKNETEKRQNAEKEIAFAKIASHVAHDIRSPLVALNNMLDGMPELSERARISVRRVIQTIRNIADNLLESNRANNIFNNSLDICSGTLPLSNEELSAASITFQIEEVLIQKNAQYANYENLRIKLNITQNDLQAFSRIQPTEFKRVISNLLKCR